MLARPVKILASMSCGMLLLSTLPQFGLLGTNQLWVAALSATERNGSLACRFRRSVEFGMTPPCTASWVWYLLPPRSLMYSTARSWFLLLAPTPRFEPPRNTGADPEVPEI